MGEVSIVRGFGVSGFEGLGGCVVYLRARLRL